MIYENVIVQRARSLVMNNLNDYNSNSRQCNKVRQALKEVATTAVFNIPSVMFVEQGKCGASFKRLDCTFILSCCILYYEPSCYLVICCSLYCLHLILIRGAVCNVVQCTIFRSAYDLKQAII